MIILLSVINFVGFNFIHMIIIIITILSFNEQMKKKSTCYFNIISYIIYFILFTLHYFSITDDNVGNFQRYYFRSFNFFFFKKAKTAL